MIYNAFILYKNMMTNLVGGKSVLYVLSSIEIQKVHLKVFVFIKNTKQYKNTLKSFDCSQTSLMIYL